MIVEPDFPDHWKTQLLIKLTADEAAPMLVIRLWAFCQQRKAWRLGDLGLDALAAVCRWKKEPVDLKRSLLESRFIEEDTTSGELIVHQWEEVNASLVRNWINGGKGGRPKTQRKPSVNPEQSDREDRIDKIEKRREEETTPPAATSRRRKKKAGATFPDQQPDPMKSRLLSLNAIFKRSATTGWGESEIRALEGSGLCELLELDFIESVEAVRAFYHADIPREMEGRYWKRTTMATLLNNWGGELDKARAWTREREKNNNTHLGAL